MSHMDRRGYLLCECLRGRVTIRGDIKDKKFVDSTLFYWLSLAREGASSLRGALY